MELLVLQDGIHFMGAKRRRGEVFMVDVEDLPRDGGGQPVVPRWAARRSEPLPPPDRPPGRPPGRRIKEDREEDEEDAELLDDEVNA